MVHLRKSPWYHRLILAVAVFGLAGCREATGPYEITEVREMDPGHGFEQPILGSSSADRFGYSAAPASGLLPALTWDVPKGWKEVAVTAMRQANLRFGPADEGECYLASAGGGLLANLNRWRRQMGLEPVDQAAADALPEQMLMGQPATLMSLKGTFTGMGASPKKNYGLHGLILEIDGRGMFVKMTGPSPLVSANIAQFDAFVRSLSVTKQSP